MSEDIAARRNKALKEFVDIINTYLLPLFDTRGSLKKVIINTQNAHANTDLITLEKEGEGSVVHFYPYIGTKEQPVPFYCKIGTYSTTALKRASVEIMRELLKVSLYDYHPPFSEKRHYGRNETYNSSYKRRTLDLAF